jgi:hypothetical protein
LHGGSVGCGRDVVRIEVIHAYLHSLYFGTPFKLVIVKAWWRLPVFSPIEGGLLRRIEHVVVVMGQFHDTSSRMVKTSLRLAAATLPSQKVTSFAECEPDFKGEPAVCSGPQSMT